MLDRLDKKVKDTEKMFSNLSKVDLKKLNELLDGIRNQG